MPAGSLDVLVRFVGDATGVKDEVSKVEGTGPKLKTWAKGVGAAVAGAFAVQQLKEFVDQASALQDATSAAGATFGTAMKDVQRFADGAAESFGMSQRAALEAATTFGMFGKGVGLAGTDLSAFATDLTGLAGDLASFKGTKPEEAVAALSSALQGQSEPMRAYGVFLDEGTIKARALAMGLVAASGDADKIAAAQISATTAQNNYNKAVQQYGKDSPEAALAAQKMELSQSKLAEATAGTVPELTQQQKTLATQAELFAQTSVQQGDFADTADSATNQQKTLSANMEDTQAAIGEALLPVIQKLLPYLSDMASFVEKNAGWLVPFAAGIMALVVVLKIATIVQTAFSISLWAALWPVLAVVAGIAAIVAIVILVIKHWDTIKAAAAAVWAAVQAAWDGILAGLQTLWQFFQTAWDAILGVIKGVWEWIKSNWPTLLAILTGPIGVAVLLITKNWDTIKGVIEAVWNWIQATWSKLTAILTAPFDLAASIIRAAIDGVRNTISGAWSFISGIVGSIVDAVTGIPDRVKDIGSKIAGLIKGPINVLIRAWNALRFEIPSVEIFGKKLGGGEIGTPHISELAKGGYVAQTGLAVVHRGETFSGVGNTLGGTVINVNVNVGAGTDPAQVGRTLVDYLRAYERANGKQVMVR